MEAPLKQRLIGAVVLAALALIFVPMLLKSPDVRDPDRADVPLTAPAEPDADGMKTIDIPLDGSAPTVTDAAPTAAALPTATEPVEVLSETSAPPSASTADPAGVAAGEYAVVIAVKSDVEANSVASGLKKLGLIPKIQSNGQLFRIRIGPYDSREQAEMARMRSTAVVSGGAVVAMDAEIKPEAASSTPVSPVPVQKSTPVASAKTPVAVAAVPTPAVKPAGESASTAKGFAVQVGAPANEAAANGLRDKMRAAGFPSYIQSVDTETGRRYRVRVGPEVDRAAAANLLAQVKQKTGIDGIIVQHP
jgi:cell division septation protein DedD